MVFGIAPTRSFIQSNDVLLMNSLIKRKKKILSAQFCHIERNYVSRKGFLLSFAMNPIHSTCIGHVAVAGVVPYLQLNTFMS